jgi:hypothetical protein
MSTVRFRGAAIGALLGAVTIAGCSGGGSQPAAHDSAAPSVQTTSTSTPSGQSLSPAQQAVVQAYEQFWRALPGASKVAADARRLAMLQPLATDPELSQLIATMHQQQAKHEVLYGAHVARVQRVTIASNRAELNDCQDASGAGIATTSGRKITVGVKRNPVVATLLLRDGTWKVSVIRYPQGTKC